MAWNTRRRKQAGTTARGYGPAHQKERANWAPIVEAGFATCARCNKRIEPGRPWHLDHDEDRTGYLGPSHATCNVRAGASNAARVANAKRNGRRRGRHNSRDW